MARATKPQPVKEQDAARVPLEAIEMLGDLVLFQLPVPKKETSSGIILPDSMAKSSVLDPSNFYKVLKVGPDVTRVKVGDIMLCNHAVIQEFPFMGMGENEYFGQIHDDGYSIYLKLDGEIMKKVKASADVKESLVQ